MKRKIYETPQANVLEVYAEGIFCISGSESQLETMGYEEFQWE